MHTQKLRDLVGTAVDLTPIGGYHLPAVPTDEELLADLDEYLASTRPFWRMFDLINWHADRAAEWMVEHPDALASHDCNSDWFTGDQS